VELTQESDIDDEYVEHVAPLKSKISKLSNKILSLEVVLKLKEVQVANLN
jgi:hypothetical protein